MIRATSTFSKWVVVDDVQYRFQALQFHSNVLAVFKAGQSMSFCGEEYEQRRLKTGSTSSTDTIRSRKTSVVQIKSKDETSDYHSDDGDSSAEEEDVFATVCYVNGCSIKNTMRLSVSDIREGIVEDFKELLEARDEQMQEPRRRHSVSGSRVYNAENMNQETLTRKFERRTSAWEMKSSPRNVGYPPKKLSQQTVFEEPKDS